MKEVITAISTLTSALCLLFIVIFDPGVRACVLFVVCLFVVVALGGLVYYCFQRMRRPQSAALRDFWCEN
jgi:uncharacterized membrane protein YqjE